MVRKQRKKSKKKLKSRPPDKVETASKDGNAIGTDSKVDRHVGEGEGDMMYMDEEQKEGVKESCFRCSVVKEQFVVSEALSNLRVQTDAAPEEGVVYLFFPSADLKEKLLVDKALADVDEEGRFCISVSNIS